MSHNILVYWAGIIGIPGKGPNWIEPYHPDKTIGQIIKNMEENKLGERNKRIEIFKFEKGNMNKYDRHNPYWNHDTKLSDYVSAMGGWSGRDVMLAYHIVG